jgi:competence protein ComEC
MGWRTWGGLLGWVLGVAAQLEQRALWALEPYLLSILAAVLLAGLAFRWPRRSAWLPALLAGALLGWGLTGWRSVDHASQALAVDLQGVTIDVTGTVDALPQRGEDSVRFELVPLTALVRDRAVRLPDRLQLSWYGQGLSTGAVAVRPHVRSGEVWRFQVRLTRPHAPSNPHGFDRERWWWEHGIGAVGSVRTGARDTPPARLSEGQAWRVDRARQWVSERIAARVPDPRSAGVLAALVVGEQSAIDADDWTLFRVTGVSHLMSISGLHVTMFAWLAVLVMGVVWRKLAWHRPALAWWMPVQQAAGIGGIALAAAYAMFAGWGVPAQRTVLMLAVVVGLRLLGRQWPWPAIWLWALAAVLLLDPWSWLQAGFWLSFVAVAILFATDPGRQAGPVSQAAGSTPAEPRSVSRLRRAMLKVGGLVREQGVVTVALTPLTVILFGQVSVVGFVANLLAIPWVTLVLTPLALIGIAVPPAWDLAAFAVHLLTLWLDALAQWSWAAVYRAIPPLGVGLLAAVGAVLLVVRLPLVVRLAGLMVIWPLAVWSPARPADGAYEVVALDVGQGSAILVRTASRSLLFDAGPRFSAHSDAGQRIVVPTLRALGEPLDTVVISHKDLDHAGGMEAVQAAWPAARWLSSFDTDPSRRCLAGQRWTWDGVLFEMLHPSPEHFDEQGQGLLSSNAMSCTLRISNAQTSAWLSGDLDAEHETRLALANPDLRATLLISPHHGSKTSSSPVLLNTLRPAWVVVQSGFRNRFGHPSPVVLTRYRERGIPWVNSPTCGAAIWRSDAPHTMRCHRETERRYWHDGGADDTTALSARLSGMDP